MKKRPKLELWVTITARESHLAALCVAGVFGALGSMMGVWVLHLATWKLNLYLCAISCTLAGVVCAWWVCELWFITLHAWYGKRSLYHLFYNVVAMFVAALTFAIFY